MHDGMPYDPIQGQGHVAFEVWNSSIFKIWQWRCLFHTCDQHISSAIFHGS